MMEMYDLIYLSYYSDAPKVLQEIWPEAKIEDASDIIHTERFVIETDVEEEEYFKTIIREGMAMFSLGFQVMMLEDGQRALRLVREVKQEMKAA